MKFNELIQNKASLQALEELGYDTPTEIQEKIIPLILDGNDVLGQSQTGTGKTLAFTLPMIENLQANKVLQTLVLAPTRELALQLQKDMEKVCQNRFHITCVFGSSSIEEQIKSLRRGSEIVVGTPGRVKDLIQRRVLKLSEIRYFVLDEADEMLSMGFQEELEFIFGKVNNDRQVLLFSATMPKPILKIAQNYMAEEYQMVSVVNDVKTAENIEQDYYMVNDKNRTEALCRLLDFYMPTRAMIFCRTKRNADQLIENLSARGYQVDVIHGDITQSQRIMTLERFRAGVFHLLIATDVAARGIHVDDVDFVFNYQMPESKEAYVHRIGRTGRAHKSGRAITLVKRNEENMLVEIENHIQTTIQQQKLPTKEEIMQKRVTSFLEELEHSKVENNSSRLFDEYLSSLSIEEMKNALASLLSQKLEASIGSDFSVSVIDEVRSKKKNSGPRQLTGKTRIFLTIGLLDKIDKKSFLRFLAKTAGVKENCFTGMEVLSKFTFVNVDDQVLNKVMKNCHNIKYNNRLIRIEVADGGSNHEKKKNNYRPKKVRR